MNRHLTIGGGGILGHSLCENPSQTVVKSSNRSNELVMDDDGNAITFASPVVMEMTDTDRPLPDAIRAFFAVDPHLESTALKILDHAGYGDEVDMEDPTKG